MPLAMGRAAPTVRCQIDCKVWPFQYYNYFTNTNKYICNCFYVHTYMLCNVVNASLFCIICCLLARFACSCCYFRCLHCWRFTLHVRLGWGGTLYSSLLTFFLWHGVMWVREREDRWGRLLYKNGLFLHRKSKWNNNESSKALISYNHKWKTTWTVSLVISGTQTHTNTRMGWKNQCTCVRKYVHVCMCKCACLGVAKQLHVRRWETPIGIWSRVCAVFMNETHCRYVCCNTLYDTRRLRFPTVQRN